MSDEQFDIRQFAAILRTTLSMAGEVGLSVGLRPAPANDRRPAGILIFIPNLDLVDGTIIAQELQPTTEES